VLASTNDSKAVTQAPAILEDEPSTVALKDAI
jgi:hypothetical protein